MLLSIGTWYAEKLRQSYVLDIELQVDCKDVPEGYIVKDAKNLHITATVKGSGYNILKSYLGKQLSVEVSVAGLKRLQTGGATWAIYVPRRRNNHTYNLPENITLQEVVSDTLYISLLKVKKKLLPIVVDDDITLATQYGLTSKKIIPDSIWVRGTNNIVDTLKCIRTRRIEQKLLNDTMRVDVDLDIPQDIYTDIYGVHVQYNIEPFTEKKITIPIREINVPVGYSVRTFPPSVKATMLLGLSKYEQTEAELFDVVADFNETKIGNKNNLVSVTLENAPNYIQHVKIQPTVVEFLLEKNK